MADEFVTVDGKPYALGKITLGDWRMLKVQFGLDASDIVTAVQRDDGTTVELFNYDNPNVLVGLLTVALSHERPRAPLRALIAEVEALEMADLDFGGTEDDEPEAEPDPTKSADDASEETAAPSKAGNSGKRPKKSGSQS